MAITKDLNIKVTIEDGNLKSKFQDMDKSFKDFTVTASKADKTSSGFGSTLKNVGGAIVVFNQGLELAARAYRALAGPIAKATQAYGIQEKAVTSLSNTLRINGQFSEQAVQDFQRFATELQRTTTVGDETTLQLLSVAKAMNLTNEQATGLVEAAANLSAATGRELQSAFQQILKTTGGYAGELGEVLPQVKELTQEQLKAGGAIELLNRQFGGFAQAAASTFLGSTQQLRNAFGDVVEVIGSLLVEFISFPGGSRGILNVLSDIQDTLEDLRPAIIEIRNNIQSFVEAFINAVNRLGGFEAVIMRVAESFRFFGLALAAIAAPAVVASLAGIVTSIVAAVGPTLAWAAGITAVAASVDILVRNFNDLDRVWALLSGAFLRFLNTVKKGLQNLTLLVLQVLEAALESIAGSFIDVGGVAETALAGVRREQLALLGRLNDTEEELESIDSTLGDIASGLDLGFLGTAFGEAKGLLETFNQELNISKEGLDSLPAGVEAPVLPVRQEAQKSFAQAVADFTSPVMEFTGSAGAIVDGLQAFVDAGPNFINKVADLINSIADLPEALFQAVANLGNALFNFIENFGANLAEFLPKIVDIVAQLPELLTQATISLIEAIPEVITKLIEAAPRFVVSFVTGITTNLPRIAVALVKGIIKGIPAIISGLIKAIPALVKALVAGIANGLSNLLGFGNIVSVPTPQDVIPQDTERAAEEFGKTAGQSFAESITTANRVFSVKALQEVQRQQETTTTDIGDQLQEVGKKERTFWEKLWDSIVAGLEKIGKFVKMLLEPLFKFLENVFTGLFEGLLGFFEGIGEGLLEVFNFINDEILKPVFGAIGDFFMYIFDKIVKPAFEFIQKVFQWILDGLMAIGKFIGDTLKAIFDLISDFWESIKQVGELLIEGLSNIWEGFKNFLNGIGEFLGEALKAFGKGLADAGRAFLDVLKNGAKEIGEALQSAGQSLLDFFKQIGNVAWDSIKNSFGNIGDAFDNFLNFGKDLWNNITSSFGNIWDAFKGSFSEFGRMLWDGVKNAFGSIGDLFGDITNPLKNLFKGNTIGLTIPGATIAGFKLWDDTDLTFFEFADGMPFLMGPPSTTVNRKSNDTIPALLSPGESVLPVSLTSDPRVQALIGGLFDKGTKFLDDIFPQSIGLADGMLGKKVNKNGIRLGLFGIPGTESVPFGDNAAETIGQVLRGEKSIGEALEEGASAIKTGFNDFGQIISVDMVKEIKKRVLDKLASLAHLPMFQKGGLVPGFGSGDIFPAMLEPGEFVINKRATDIIGAGRLNTLNRSPEFDGFGSGNVTINIEQGAVQVSAQEIDEDFVRRDLMNLIRNEMQERSERGEYFLDARGVRT